MFSSQNCAKIKFRKTIFVYVLWESRWKRVRFKVKMERGPLDTHITKRTQSGPTCRLIKGLLYQGGLITTVIWWGGNFVVSSHNHIKLVSLLKIWDLVQVIHIRYSLYSMVKKEWFSHWLTKFQLVHVSDVQEILDEVFRTSSSQ